MSFALLLLACAAVAPPDDEPLRLTLDDAVRMASERNLAISRARLDAEAAVQGFNAAWGVFDTRFFATGTASRTVTAPAPATVFGGFVAPASAPTQRNIVDLSTGFSGTLLSGTLWSFSLVPHSTEIEQGAFTTKSYTGNWSFEVTQPLWKGGGDYAVSSLELARADATIATLAAESLATQTIQEVTVAYWNLVFTAQALRTRELSVELSEELLEITRRKFEQGLQNRINVTEVEAELATYRQDLLQARNAHEAARDELLRLILAPENAEQWGRALEPVTQATPAQVTQIDLQAAIDTALADRANVAGARLEVERAEIELRRARNQVEPRFDLTGRYGLNSNEESYGAALGALDDTTYNDRALILSYEVPIGNRTAGYELRRNEVARQRAGVSLRDVELTVVTEVRGAVRNVLLQGERVAATTEAARLQQEVYEGERRRLENDLSTPFLVRQSQRDLFTALDNQTRAQLDLELARSALLAAQGHLLRAYGYERRLPELSIDVAPPAP